MFSNVMPYGLIATGESHEKKQKKKHEIIVFAINNGIFSIIRPPLFTDQILMNVTSQVGPIDKLSHHNVPTK